MIKVGVVGHRYLAEIEKITTAVDQTLNHIAGSFGNVPLQIISSLAEGADRLVAQRALERHDTSLLALLPLPKQEYIKDFSTSASRDEFRHLLGQADRILTLTEVSQREQAYQAAGHYLLQHADVIIAIWDGKQAQGQGGTGEIALEARRRQLPLAWIHAGNRRPGTEQPTSLGEEQGRVTWERLPD